MLEPFQISFEIDETVQIFTGFLEVFASGHEYYEDLWDDANRFYLHKDYRESSVGNRHSIQLYRCNFGSFDPATNTETLRYTIRTQPVVISAMVKELSGRLLIDMACYSDQLVAHEVFAELWDGIVKRWPGVLPDDGQAEPQQSGGPIDLTSKPAGRRPDPENIEAYKIVLAGGKTEEAYKRGFEYWCRVKNIENPEANERSNYKQTMKRMERYVTVP